MQLRVVLLTTCILLTGCKPGGKNESPDEKPNNTLQANSPTTPPMNTTADTPRPTEDIKPGKAYELVQDGAIYLDVRSVSEFTQSHPADAYNVPIIIFGDDGQRDKNGNFLEIVKANFSPKTPIVCGCKSGMRSSMAADMLAEAGFEQVYNMVGGMGGAKVDGESVPGWEAAGLPVESGEGGSKSYAALKSDSHD